MKKKQTYIMKSKPVVATWESKWEGAKYGGGGDKKIYHVFFAKCNVTGPEKKIDKLISSKKFKTLCERPH